jgi:putative PEP-CTERM system histidine kinase
MSFPALLTLVSIVLLAAVIVRHVRGDQRPQQRLFVLAALVFAAAQTALLLMLLTHEPARSLAIALAAAAATIPARLFIARFHFAADGSLLGMSITGAGKAAAGYFIVVNIIFLHLFENTYRAAKVADKVMLKYPFLGILAASIINIAVMSRVLAIAALGRGMLAIHSSGIIALCASFLYASTRYSPFALRITMPRNGRPSIVSVTIAGLYLLALALITPLARVLGLPHDRFLVTVLGIFGIFLLIALLISDGARRRLRTCIGENFYLQRYNYRNEWRRYAEIMEAGSTIEEFLSNVISSLCDTMVVRRGLFWVDFAGGKAGWCGFPHESVDRGLLKELLRITEDRPIVVLRRPLERPPGAASDEEWGWVRAIARLGQRADTRGIIAIGEMESGRAFTDEDRDFLSLIAYRARLTLENMLMEERIIESRQMESFKRFASFVAHDLKNTIGTLSLMAENARVNIESPEFQKDALGAIQRSVDKIQRLITSLDARTMPSTISKTETDLSELVRSTVDSMKSAVEKRGLGLKSKAEPGLCARIDPSAVKRVIENLVLNAIEATPRGGTVTVDVARAGKDWVRITVRDTGPGFDTAYLREGLFRPFHSTKKEGLGVGLVLCKSLVESHGGRISIESAPGAGAAVTVILPALPAAGR